MKNIVLNALLLMGIAFQVQAQDGRYNQSSSTFDKYQEYLFLDQGKDKMRANRYGEALQDFNRAISINPYNAEAYHLRGNAFFLVKRFQDALSDYNNAIQLYEQQNVQASRSTYNNQYYTARDGVSIIPSSDVNASKNTLATLYYNRGAVLYQLNRIQEANIEFDRANRLNPNLNANQGNMVNTSNNDGYSWENNSNNQNHSLRNNASLARVDRTTTAYNTPANNYNNYRSNDPNRQQFSYSDPIRGQAPPQTRLNTASRYSYADPIAPTSQPLTTPSNPVSSSFSSGANNFSSSNVYSDQSYNIQGGDNMTELAPSRERNISPRRKSVLDFFSSRIYRNPTVVSQTSKMAKISRISVEKNGTFILVEVVNDSTEAIGVKVIAPGQPGAHFMIDPGTNLTYELRAVNGPVSAYAATWVDPGDKLSFELVFDKIPNETDFIHIVEDTTDDGDEDISFYDVYLD